MANNRSKPDMTETNSDTLPDPLGHIGIEFPKTEDEKKLDPIVQY